MKRCVLVGFLILIGGVVGLGLPSKVKAQSQACITCMYTQPAYSNTCLAMCYPSCPSDGTWIDVASGCGSIAVNETCCTTSGGCSSQCEHIDQWGWCHVGSCQAMADRQGAGTCLYHYRYSYTNCGAKDTCENTVTLKAGQCSSTGCAVGGTYKVCCSGGVPQTCTGGQFTGSCPGGWQMARMCGYGSYPSCSNPAAVCADEAEPTDAPTPTTGAGGATGVPPTGNVPTTPPGCTHACGSGQNSWCTPDSAACASLPNGVYHTDWEAACCGSASDHVCCSNKPPTGGSTVCGAGTATYIDVYREKSYFNVAVSDANPVAGDQVTVTVGQWPRGDGYGSQCECKYNDIDVYLNPGGKICRISGFKEGGCPDTLTCNWDTTGLSTGHYEISAQYGGHSDSGCLDGIQPCGATADFTAPACNNDEVTLSVNPNPADAGYPVTFGIAGDASTDVGDNYGGGASGCSGSWSSTGGSKTCTASATSGNYTWEHTWKHCVGSTTNCSETCRESISYKVNTKKTCSIESIFQPTVGSVMVAVSGKGNVNPGTENVRLSLEKTDASQMASVPGGTNETGPYSNLYWWYMADIISNNSACLSTNAATCYASTNITGLKRGIYYVHCDLPTDPKKTKCSGNPFCAINENFSPAQSCAGWVPCSASDFKSFEVLNSPPTWTSLVLKNVSGTVVTAETGSRNQICQSAFSNSRRVTFEVNVADADGSADIGRVELRLKRTVDPLPTYTVYAERFDSGAYGSNASLVSATMVNVGTIGVKATFTIDFDSTFTPQAIYDMVAYARDTYTTPAEMTTDTGRDLKIWDCQVPVTGTVYDGSAAAFGAPVCKGEGFSMRVEDGIFNTLVYKNTTTADKTMTVFSTLAKYLSDSSSHLIWGGGNYTPAFNYPDGLPGAGLVVQVTDKTTGLVSCPSLVFGLTAGIDPYQVVPEAIIDFSFVKNQGPWYQTVSGGILSAQPITSMVPPTCQLPCVNALSINGVGGTNGLVAADGPIENGSGCIDCPKGSPKDWFVENKNITNSAISYASLKRDYYDRLGIGVTFSAGAKNWTDVVSGVGSSVMFVNGNLTIDGNNFLPIGRFLMVVVNGSVTFNDPTKNRFDGIIVADGMVKVMGESEMGTTLQINGSIYTRGGFINERSLGSGSENNNTPSVKINYRPDFVFSMPAELTKSTYNWREGN